MMKYNFKLLSGAISVLVYLLLSGSVLYYFSYRTNNKPINYVEKNTNTIEVSLASETKVSKKALKPKKHNKKHRASKIRNIKSKQTSHSKSKKSKKIAKKINANSLFSDVSTSIKKESKIKTSKQKIKSLKKEKNGSKGRENRYFAKVQRLLMGWPEQINYAGEIISVSFTIYRDGNFKFKIKKLSANSEFNEALIAYLRQLQSIGFGKHHNSRAYRIDVEFEAN